MGATTAGHVERLAANLLKVARARAGMSQRELADAAHVAQSTVARIESGTRQPSLPVLARILAAIDLEMRITLEAYDNHDDTLDAVDNRLSAEQRAVRRATQDQFAAQLRENGPGGVTRRDAFDPRRIIETLNRHRVDYVLVGGYAAQLYGARRPTYDIDIAPSTALDNLHRLSHALRVLDAGIRVDDLAEGLPFDSSAESLRGMQMLNLRTPLGDLDLMFAPAGFPDGYDGLLPGAHPHSIGHVTVQVADLDDVIKSKSAAARPKDLDALPELIDIAEARHKAKDRDDG